MKWLVDNNVPRGVTTLLLDLGHEVAEVRQALADNAPDSSVAAYAAAEGFVLVTHDRGLARRCLLAGYLTSGCGLRSRKTRIAYERRCLPLKKPLPRGRSGSLPAEGP